MSFKEKKQKRDEKRSLNEDETQGFTETELSSSPARSL
jgi:hypothetical protein